MARDAVTTDPAGRQPDMERGLEAAARAGGAKPADQTNEAVKDDVPEAADLAAQESAAAEILRRNAAKDTGGR